MWVLIVNDQEERREQVCESKTVAEKHRGELMKKGVFATVEFRREKAHEFNSGRAMKQQSKAPMKQQSKESVTPDRLQVLARRFRKS